MRLVIFIFPVIMLIGCSGSRQFDGRDWNDDVMYMIVTDRFDNGDPGNDALNGTPSPADPDGIHGGDLCGIERRLPYLKRLGISAIWLTPVAKNAKSSYHGYWIQDFTQVDPRLGTLEDLRRMINAAHELGIRVYLDIVCNHTAPLARPVGDRSEWNDSGYAYQWNDSTDLPSPPLFRDLAKYHHHGNTRIWSGTQQILGELPGGLNDLRTEDPEVRAELIRIWTWWMEQTGCDGFRVDTVKHVEIGFWYEFIAALKDYACRLGRRFFVFGEVYSYDDEQCSMYTKPDSFGRQGFDAILNFSLSGSIRSVFAQHQPVSMIEKSLNNAHLYSESSRPYLPSFVDNHDIKRFLHEAHGDTTALRNALTFLFTCEGIPIVYYGTEQSFMGGEGDGDNREDLFAGAWKNENPKGDSFNESSKMYRLTESLTALRRECIELRKGAVRVLEANDSTGVLIMERSLGSHRTIVIVNNGSMVRHVAFKTETPFRRFSDRSVIPASNGTMSISVPALSVEVLTSM